MSKYEKFGRDIYEYLNSRGWYSIPRRELAIAILHYAGESGLLSLDSGIHSLSAEIKIPVTTLKGLLRDKNLFYGQFTEWTDDDFLEWLKNNECTSVEDAKKGLLVYKLLNIDEYFSVQTYLEKLSIVPDYKNNRDLIVFDIESLVKTIARNSDSRSEMEIVKKLIAETNFNSIGSRIDKSKYKTIKEMFADAIIEKAENRLGIKTTELIVNIFNKIINDKNNIKYRKQN